MSAAPDHAIAQTTLDADRAGAVAPARAKAPKGVVAATVAGNALEFYDFVSYAYFAVYIGKTFFPLSTPMGSLLASVAVFGVGFVTRPLGGVLIGAYADRVGRRAALLLTIGLITVGTLGLALTPGYAQIGMAAPILVVISRLVQGLALGGDVGPATAFLVESAAPGRRGLLASWQLASQGAATFTAGLLGLTLSLVLTPDDLLAWGWRVPFALGLVLLPVAFYLRRTMPETLDAAPGSVPGKTGSLRPHAGVIVIAIFVILGGTVSTYVGSYMTTYAINTLKLAPSVALGATVAGGISTLGFALIGGWLSDRHGRRITMIWPRILTALLTVPAFILLSGHPDAIILLSVTAFLNALTALSAAPSLVAITEILPLRVRATGMAIAYAVGVSLFGGTTQFVITWLLSATGNPVAPAWYVVGTSLITLVAMWRLPEGQNRDAGT